MRIAHVAAEVSPFAKTGGLGDVAGALPKMLGEMGHDVQIWMPFYRQVREWLGRRDIAPELVIGSFHVDVGFSSHEVALLKTTLPDSNVPVYLVAADYLFDRPSIYSAGPFGDDGIARYSIFVRAVFESMRRLQLVPDILHAHDWHTALAPMAVAWDQPRDWHFDRTATVLTIHNAAYQGIYPPDKFMFLGLPEAAFSPPGVMWDGAVNMLKGAVLAADAITAVSPTFAHELQSRDGGFGLDPVLRFRGRDLSGIVNGIDPHVWSPSVDQKIPARYDVNSLEKKRENRRELLRRASMNADDAGFVIGMVGRLTDQKGYDLFFPVMDELIREGIRFVFLGSGDPLLEQSVHFYSRYRPGQFWGHVGFDDDLAHLIEAGADAFLMPSRFEPCGLNQLYSLAYGTPPIVRRVGGLVDTVVAYDGSNLSHATGFGFDAPESFALRETVRWAHRAYKDARVWTQLIHNGMTKDFSWKRSADQYVDVYQRILSRKGR
jgi:starch synthase